MATTLVVKANTTANDTTDAGNFVTMDLTNDKFIWSDGSAAVIDGGDTPTDAELNEAAPLVPSGAVYEIPKLFLLDYSATGQELKQMDNAGSDQGGGGDYRYVLRFEFSDATATEPTLEAWDNSDHDSYADEVLGVTGTVDSYIKVVRTTDGAPGASWAGTQICGGSNKSNMNGSAGAFVAAATVYYNIKVVLPDSCDPFANTPVITVRFTWN